MEEKEKDKKIQDFGQVVLENNKKHGKIHLMTIIGEIEGHDVLPASSKSTKYEHILPQLASIEDNEEIDGVLFLINTVGGDVSCGLALAEIMSFQYFFYLPIYILSGVAKFLVKHFVWCREAEALQAPDSRCR